MKESYELQRLISKVGFTGTLVSSTLLGASIYNFSEVPKITIGILCLSLIGSNMLLVKDYKIRKIQKEKSKQKIKKRVEK